MYILYRTKLFKIMDFRVALLSLASPLHLAQTRTMVQIMHFFEIYSNIHDSYICFKPKNHKIYFSRHVQFVKDQFPSLPTLHTHDKINDHTLSGWFTISPSLKSLFSQNPASPNMSSHSSPFILTSPSFILHNNSYSSSSHSHHNV